MRQASVQTTAASRARQHGGFLFGMFVGLFIGLAIALGIAVYLNKTPVPFMNRKPADTKAEPSGAPVSKAADKPKFDFYKILPGSEEPVSDKELKAAARAADGSKDLYFLQAGSFANPVDADNRKAQLAILGYEASVEPSTVPEKGTIYRVRLGPYTRVEEVNKVKDSLKQNGIEADPVKIKDPAAAKK